MNFSLKNIQKYCVDWSDKPADYMAELERETHLKTLAPQMISGALQGRFLSMISHMLRPKYILEIGTFTGYGALCLAEGLAPGGKLITLESNPELAAISSKYFKKSGLGDGIQPVVGDAMKIIPTLDNEIDLVFIDAGKLEYPAYFDLVIDKVRTGGFILADNVLWSGKIIAQNKDADTTAIHAFNQKVLSDPRVQNVILPVRDGLSISVKK